jgi:hypothetical protein
MYTKDSKMKEEDLVLIETQDIDEKCGKCGSKLILKVFWTREDYQHKIECSKCDLAIWRSPKKSYD